MADPDAVLNAVDNDPQALVEYFSPTDGPETANACSKFRERGQAARKVVTQVSDPLGSARAPVFISGDRAATDLALLKELGISHIVNATTNVPDAFPEQFRYLRVPVLDTPMPVTNTDLMARFPVVIDFIATAREQGTGVLVHCMWGVSRSVALVLAYLISPKWPGERYTLKAALEHVGARRGAAQPNSSFMRQLIAYEKQVQGGEGSIMLDDYRGACVLRETSKTSLSELVSGLEATKQKVVVCEGHVMHVERLCSNPRMARISGFLTPEECDAVIDYARRSDLMHRSYTAGYKGQPGQPDGMTYELPFFSSRDNLRCLETEGNTASYAYNVGDSDKVSRQALVAGTSGRTNSEKVSVAVAGRTSHSCRIWRGEPVAHAALIRAAKLAGLSHLHSEALQVVHYDVSQQYREHYDFFDSDVPGYAERMGEQGQRLLTVFVYLNECEEGGCTYFPNLNFRYRPRKGTAILWYNLDRDGVPDKQTLHAGEPVHAGEKWGMNIWLRERGIKPSAKGN